MQNLNVALVQTNITWHQPKENRKQLDAKIKTLKNNVDLVILPEMFSTGFSMDPQNIAETMYGETISWMLNLAKIKNIAIAGSLIIVEDNKYYNRFVFVHP
ncbi:MAG: nitrilase-related carbon-nitrogen hydrolase, partial [Lutibacter sp.]